MKSIGFTTNEDNRLPKFETDFKFIHRYARYNKLTVNFDVCTFDTTEVENAAEMFIAIAGNSDLFTTSQNTRNSYPELRIVKECGEREEELLFSGVLKTYANNRKYGSSRKAIRAYININPTRYFSYNHDRDNTEPFSDLFKNPRTSQQCIATTLDSSNNFIQDTALLSALRADWKSIFERYLTSVRNMLVHELEKTGGSSAVSEDFSLDDDPLDTVPYHLEYLEGISAWTITHAEVYFEFETAEDMAVSHVNDFGKYLKNSYGRTQNSFYASDIKNDYRGMSYKYNTSRKNEVISLYAKASNRMRFEYRYIDNPKMSDLFKSSRYSSHSKDGLLYMLEDLTAVSIGKLEDIETLYSEYQQVESTSPADIYGDLEKMLKAAGRNKKVYLTQMIRSIQRTGKVSATQNVKFSKFLAKLEEQNVLIALRKQNKLPREYIVNERMRGFLK